MTAVVRSKAFRSGNSIAVRLPKAFGIAEGTEVEIEQRAGSVIVRPIIDPVAEKARLTAMIARLRAIGPVGEIEVREPFDSPERAGL